MKPSYDRVQLALWNLTRTTKSPRTEFWLLLIGLALVFFAIAHDIQTGRFLLAELVGQLLGWE